MPSSIRHFEWQDAFFSILPMTVEGWLHAAIADAERRGLDALKPILESLARSTAALREAEREVAPAAIHIEHTDEDR